MSEENNLQLAAKCCADSLVATAGMSHTTLQRICIAYLALREELAKQKAKSWHQVQAEQFKEASDEFNKA